MTDLRQHAVEITEQFSDSLDVDADDVEGRLETLVDDYSVPLEEARRSVVSTYLDEADMDRDTLAGGTSQAADVADIDAPEEWLDLRGQVEPDRKSTRLNSSHRSLSRMPSSA